MNKELPAVCAFLDSGGAAVLTIVQVILPLFAFLDADRDHFGKLFVLLTVEFTITLFFCLSVAAFAGARRLSRIWGALGILGAIGYAVVKLLPEPRQQRGFEVLRPLERRPDEE